MSRLQLGKGDMVPGQRLNLAKASSSELKTIKICLGWDENRTGGSDYDPDVVLAMMDSAKVKCELENFYFYGNLVSKDGEQKSLGGNSFEVVRPGYITHWGDNRTGAGQGDKETIEVKLDKVPSHLVFGLIAVTIFEATERRQNFGMMSNAYIRIINADTNEQLGKLDLDFDASTETGVIFGALMYHNNEWYFSAPPAIEPIVGGLAGFASKYKIGQ
jgi:tellurium resistance protein TerD